MAVTQRRRSVVNSARRKNAGRKRKLSAAQIAAGFGGKRRQSAQKASRKTKRKNRAVAKSRPAHRPRTAPRRKAKAQRKNLGKIISYSLPKESQSMAKTKVNRARRKATSHHTKRRATKRNTGHRTRRRSNPGMADITGLASTAVFTIAGAVGTKYLTQAVLQGSNTGTFGYLGNAVAAFALSWGASLVPALRNHAKTILAGGIVQVVLRLINDLTPYGQYTANLGMGDYQCAGLGNYTKQNAPLPYRMVDGLHSAQIANYQNYNTSGTNGMGCYGYGDLYSFAAA